MTGDLSNLRKEYLKSGIVKGDLKTNPIEQFSLWFSQAIEANIVEPSAMSLATSDDYIGIRTVLLKYFDDKGFVFFTNYESKKSKQIQNNPQAALLFPWLALERQVKIIGSVEKRRIRRVIPSGRTVCDRDLYLDATADLSSAQALLTGTCRQAVELVRD